MSYATREALLEQYRTVRRASLEMVRPLSPEDFRIQPSEEVSPPLVEPRTHELVLCPEHHPALWR